MSCLEYQNLSLMEWHNLYNNAPEFLGLHVIVISERVPSNKFQISGKISERPFNNVSMTKISGSGTINGVYWTHSPDEDTLSIIIDDQNGTVHMLCNDCLYMRYAMTKYVFKNREHYHQCYSEFDIKALCASCDSDSAVERCYIEIFGKETEIFYLLKENGISLF